MLLFTGGSVVSWSVCSSWSPESANQGERKGEKTKLFSTDIPDLGSKLPGYSTVLNAPTC